MNIRFLLGTASVVLTMASAVPFFRAVIKGSAKLERGAYTIWLVLPIIALITQAIEGGTDSLGLAIGDTVTGLVFFGMIFKYGYGGVAKRDAAALILAGIGLGLWYLTNNPAFALYMAIVVDAIGSALIFVKAYESPESEVASSWVLYIIGALCALFAVSSTTFVLLAYPAYAVISSALILASQQVGYRRQVHLGSS